MTAFSLHPKRLSGISLQTLSTCGLLLTASCGEAVAPEPVAPRVQAQRVEDTCSPDDTPPVVTCPEYGGTVQCGAFINSRSAPGLQYSDNCGIQSVSTPVNRSNTPGTTLDTSASVSDGRNTATCTTSWSVIDTLAPSVYLAGEAEVSIYQGRKYSEYGIAYIYDLCDGPQGYQSKEISGTVNTAIPGTYTVNYRVTDHAGNVGTTTRTVHVLPDLATVTAEGTSLQAHVRQTLSVIDYTQLLVIGGYSRAAETYNFNTKTWTATGLPLAAHRGHTATRFNDGTVLVAGGARSGTSSVEELYDPQTRQWSATGKMSTVRYDHVALELNNGLVLVAGGGTGESSGGALASAELYNPATRTWTLTGSMLTARRGATATLLPDGQVLVTGGLGTDGTPQATTELYSPTTGTWTSVGSLSTGRASHSATLLRSGKVLVVGGQTKNTALGATTEMYDPATRTWYARRSLGTARRDHAALSVLGKLVVLGGYSPQSGILASTEVYDEASDTWTANTSLSIPRYKHSVTVIGLAMVLVVSGTSNQDSTQSELFTMPQHVDDP